MRAVKTRDQNSRSAGVATSGTAARISSASLRQALDSRGWARIPQLLSTAECRALAAVYRNEKRFRSFIDLGGHGYGEHGDYRYFARPLPRLVQRLRTQLYRALAPIANGWEEALGSDRRFPASLTGMVRECEAAGQLRPTPLLLRYDEGGLNFLHQDRYGAVAFPLQVVVMLSQPGGAEPETGRDFGGGEFLLVEQRPRQQSRGEALRLEQGEALVFPNATRPIEGKRGTYRATVRHGVSRVLWGERMTLGLIFHDAE